MDPNFDSHYLGHLFTDKISSMIISLTKEPLEYRKIAQKIEFWIEYTFRERIMTVDRLVWGVSLMRWDGGDSYTNVGRFLKEFRDTPHRSEQARSFVDKLCEDTLQTFAIKSAGNVSMGQDSSLGPGGAKGFIGRASLIGYFIERGLLSHEFVRRHLVKPLIAHHYTDCDGDQKSVRAMVIYQLFVAARDILLQGLLEPEDIQACFETLDTEISLEGIAGPDTTKLNVQYSALDASHLYLLTNF